MDMSDSTQKGSPPRVRSRPQRGGRRQRRHGITSACAKQTRTRRGSRRPAGDHLRVCGADRLLNSTVILKLGSPPRVRSRHNGAGSLANPCGITSACAEQTMIPSLPGRLLKDHLRVCGADAYSHAQAKGSAGSPPRVRSRHHPDARRPIAIGITSACAEQTSCAAFSASGTRDHLRVCGADTTQARRKSRIGGSPPRVRSRHRLVRGVRPVPGITSACAEQTKLSAGVANRETDHLRVCGADRRSSIESMSSQGSPPRVRSRPYEHPHQRDEGRITSACAEQTL